MVLAGESVRPMQIALKLARVVLRSSMTLMLTSGYAAICTGTPRVGVLVPVYLVLFEEHD